MDTTPRSGISVQHQLEQLDMEKILYDTVIADSVNTEKPLVRNILGAFLF